MHHDDIDAVANIHCQQFPGQHYSTQWVSCNLAAFPRIMMFVARDEKDDVIGYVQWSHKNGFRKATIIELEQIAVIKTWQGAGIGTKLIKGSLDSIKDFLDDSGSMLKAVMVSTRADNAAQGLYKKALGAQVIAVIKDLYSHDEVLMLAREL